MLSSAFNTKHTALNSWQWKRGPLIRYYRVLRASKEVNYPEVPSVAFSKRCPAAVVGAAGGKSAGGGPDSATHWPCDLPQERGRPYWQTCASLIGFHFFYGRNQYGFRFSTQIHLLSINQAWSTSVSATQIQSYLDTFCAFRTDNLPFPFASTCFCVTVTAAALVCAVLCCQFVSHCVNQQLSTQANMTHTHMLIWRGGISS